MSVTCSFVQVEFKLSGTGLDTPYTLVFMDIILTDIQARRVQRMARQSQPCLRLIRKSPCGHPTACPAELIEQVVRPVLEMLDIIRENEPVHVRIFGTGRKTTYPGIQLHRTTAHIPSGSFDEIVASASELGLTLKEAGVRIFVDGPSLCVLGLIQTNLAKTTKGQLSRKVHPFAQGLTLASEFCGTYACDPHSPRLGKPTYGIPPVLTIEELRSFSDEVGPVTGATVLHDVVTYLEELHASPMEVLVYALAVVRPSLGGLSLPRPEVNKPLGLSAKQLKMITHKQITPDLYWKAYEEAVEYDGSDHNSEEAIKRDKRRIVDYQTLGITVFPATKDCFKDTQSADAYMRSITRHMEKYEGATFRHRMDRLFKDEGHRTRREMLRKAIQSCP